MRLLRFYIVSSGVLFIVACLSLYFRENKTLDIVNSLLGLSALPSCSLFSWLGVFPSEPINEGEYLYFTICLVLTISFLGMSLWLTLILWFYGAIKQKYIKHEHIAKINKSSFLLIMRKKHKYIKATIASIIFTVFSCYLSWPSHDYLWNDYSPSLPLDAIVMVFISWWGICLAMFWKSDI